MAAIAAELKVKVSAEGVETTSRQLNDVGQKAEHTKGLFDELKKGLEFGTGMRLADVPFQAMGMLRDQMVDVIRVAMVHQEVEAQTAQVLKSTNAVSGMTAASLEGLASAFSKTTQYSQDTVLGGENLLLTFTNIGKNTFPQATQAILDVSTAMHQDLQTSAIQVGKALNDPLTGMANLQRIGVTFSATEKEQIKDAMAHNNLLAAQKIVLHELSTEFGGSATAQGKTFAGQMAIMNNQIEDMKIKLGTALLPYLAKLVSFLDTTALPALDKFSDWMGNTAIPDIQKLGDLTEGVRSKFIYFKDIVAGDTHNALTILDDQLRAEVIPNFQLLGTTISGDVSSPMHQLADYITTTFIQSLNSSTSWIQSTGIPVYDAYAKEVRNVLGASFIQAGADSQMMLAQIKLSASQLPSLMKAMNISANVKFSVPSGGNALGDMFSGIGTAAQNAMHKIQAVLAPIVGWIQKNVITPIVQEWNQMATDLAPFFSQFMNVMQQLGLGHEKLSGHISATGFTFKDFLDIVRLVIEGLVKGALAIGEFVIPALAGLVDKIQGAGGALSNANIPFGTFIQDIKDFLQYSQPTIKDMNDLAGASQNLANALGNIGNNIPGLQGIGNFFQLLGNEFGFGNGKGTAFQGVHPLIPSVPGTPPPFPNPGINIRAHAKGIFNNPLGHWAMVGEEGPEKMYVPQGASILPHGMSPSALGGSSQPIVLVMDGRTVARGLMPHVVESIRNQTGVRF